MNWTLWLMAWSLMTGRVEAQNPSPFRITGAVVSREFPPGPADPQRVDPETEFLTTDPMAVVTFGYFGGKKGDKVRVEWRNPFGAVAQEWVIDQVGGSYGWYQNLAIAGAPASKMPGNWELRILWNDQGVATFPFRISVPPASAVHFGNSTVLPRGTMNVPFSFQFKADSGAAPYRWSIVGSAPPGLILSPAGDLTGVPSRRGSYKLVIRVEDSAGNSLTRGVGLGIAEVSPGPHVSSRVLTRSPASPDACATAPGTANFSSQDLTAWVAFKVEDAVPEDGGRVEWLDPFGEVSSSIGFARKADPRRCYEFNLPIAGTKAASMPGNWRVRLFWREAEIMTIPFQISTAAGGVLPGRRALVAGNSVFKKLPGIPSVAADCTVVAEALRQDGFDVAVIENSTLEELQRAEGEFVAKLQPGDVAVVYFTGYGFQRNGDNWLPAANFDPADSRPAANAYSVRRLRGELDERRVRLAVIVLDAAREQPALAGVGQGTGLARMTPDQRTILVYSVPPGRIEKLAGDAGPSPFAQGFVKAISESGIGVQELLLRNLPKTVTTLAAGRVPPLSLIETSEEFVFRTPAVRRPAEFAPPAVAQKLAGVWQFSRVESANPRLPVGPLCTFNFTQNRGTFGYVISSSCNPNESFWRVDGERLYLVGSGGIVTSVLSKTSDDYWKGPFFVPDGSVHSLGRADAASLSIESLTALPCGRPLKTEFTGKPIKLLVRNDSAEEKLLVWIDGQGQPRDYGTVAPGRERVMETYQGHVWMVEERDRSCVEYFRGGDREALVVIGKK